MKWKKTQMTIDINNQVSILITIDVHDDMDNEDVEKEAKKIMLAKFGINFLDQVCSYELHPL
jgi:hypothetical protein